MNIPVYLTIDGAVYGLNAPLPFVSLTGGACSTSANPYAQYTRSGANLTWVPEHQCVTGTSIPEYPWFDAVFDFGTVSYTPSNTGITTNYTNNLLNITSVISPTLYGTVQFVVNSGTSVQILGTATAITPISSSNVSYAGTEGGLLYKITNWDTTPIIGATLTLPNRINSISQDSTYLYVTCKNTVVRITLATFTIKDTTSFGTRTLYSSAIGNGNLYLGTDFSIITVDLSTYSYTSSYSTLVSDTLNTTISIDYSINAIRYLSVDSNYLYIADRYYVIQLNLSDFSVNQTTTPPEEISGINVIGSNLYIASRSGTIRTYSTSNLHEGASVSPSFGNISPYNDTSSLGEYVIIPNSEGTLTYRCGITWTNNNISFNIVSTPTSITSESNYQLTNAISRPSVTPTLTLGISRTTNNETWSSFPTYYKGVTSSLPSSGNQGDICLVDTAFSTYNIGDILIYSGSEWVNLHNWYTCAGYCDLIPLPGELYSEASLFESALEMDFPSVCLSYKGSIDLTITHVNGGMSIMYSTLPTSPTNGDWYSIGSVTYVGWSSVASGYTRLIQPSDILVYQTSTYSIGWGIIQPGQQLRSSCLVRNNKYAVYDPKVTTSRNNGKTFEPGIELNVVHSDGTVIPTTTTLIGSENTYALTTFPQCNLTNNLNSSGRMWNVCNNTIVGETSYFIFNEPTYTNPFYVDRFTGVRGTQFAYKYPQITSLKALANEVIFASGHFQNGLYDDLSQNFDAKSITNTWQATKVIHDRLKATNKAQINGYNTNWVSGTISTRGSGSYQPSGGDIYSAGYDYTYVTLDAVNNLAYVSSFLNNSIYVINLATNKIIFTLPVPNSTGIALNGSSLYVAQGHTNSILVYEITITKDPTTHVITNITISLTATLTSLLLKCPHGISIDSSETLWIANWFAGGIVQYSGGTFTQSSVCTPESYITSVISGSPFMYTANKGMCGQSTSDSYAIALAYSGANIGGVYGESPYSMGVSQTTYSGTEYTFITSYLLNTVFINSTGYTLNHPCGVVISGKYAYIACTSYLAICDLSQSTLTFTKTYWGNSVSRNTGSSFALDVNVSDLQPPMNNVLSFWGGQATDGSTLVNSNFLKTENNWPPTLNYPSALNVPVKEQSGIIILQYKVYPLFSDLQNTYAFVYVNGIGIYQLVVIRSDFNDSSNTSYETYQLPIQPLYGEPVVGWLTSSGLTLVYPTSKSILRVYQSSDYHTWNLTCWSDNTGISWKTGTIGLV